MEKEQLIKNISQKTNLMNKFIQRLKTYVENRQELIILKQLEKINNTSLKNFHDELINLDIENLILKDIEFTNEYQNKKFISLDKLKNLPINKFREDFKTFLTENKSLNNTIEKDKISLFSNNPHFELILNEFKQSGKICFYNSNLIGVNF